MRWRIGSTEHGTGLPWWLLSDCGRYTVARYATRPEGADPMSRDVAYRWEAWRCRDDAAKVEPLRLGDALTANEARRLAEAHAKANPEPEQRRLIA